MYGEGPTRVETGAFTDTNRKPFGPEDIRFTQKAGMLYAIVLSADLDQVRVRSLGSSLGLEPRTIAKVELVGGGECKFERGVDNLMVQLPDSDKRRHAVALKLTFE